LSLDYIVEKCSWCGLNWGCWVPKILNDMTNLWLLRPICVLKKEAKYKWR